ncbi:hypothetical protein JXX18_21870, partial [Ruthenibacterium lactatiformans]|uniref:hypothetical protein n=2 Tax=Ruthenibacterium lactatiformans TaxID=1550024 RepID=UPI001967D5E9
RTRLLSGGTWVCGKTIVPEGLTGPQLSFNFTVRLFCLGGINMELEEKFKEAKVPMIVVHFDENFETTYTEEYNLGNFELSKCQIESFARILLPSIREYYKDPKHVHESNELAKQQNKQSIDT